VEEVTLTAPDISCDHCIAAIRKALSKLVGVQFLGGHREGYGGGRLSAG
jgi:copper chaperone CopZ